MVMTSTLWIAVTCFAALAIVVVVDGAELTMKPLGELHYKPLGGAMVFTCEVTTDETDEDDAEYTIQWFDANGREIFDKTGRRYVEEEGTVKKLYITDIETSDEGSYKCVASTPNGEIQPSEKTASLKLFKEITFESAVSPQHPRSHSDALIRCVVSGQPAPDVSWRYKGQRLVIGPRSRYTKVVDGLSIRNITVADDGDYTCRAEVESDGRYDEKRILVEVHIPPKLVEEPGKVEGLEGEEATIVCRATSLPAAEFQFFKGGVKIEPSSRVQVDKTAGTLRFSPLLKSDEGTDYNCTATNDVGSDSATGELHVLVKPSVTQFNDVIQQERNTATLVCLARGDPKPSISFRKVGMEADYLPSDNDDSRVSVTELESGGAELTIDDVSPQDAGNYRCTVKSEVGQNSSTAKLTVEYEPTFSADHAKVEHIWAGKTRNVICRPSAEPSAVVEWKRNGVKLENNGTFVISQVDDASILQVTVREQDQSWIYGVYTCVAQNRLGTKEIDVDLRRASVPDAPKAVSTKTRSPTTIVVSVEPPEEDGGMPVSGYRVEYNDVTYDISAVSASVDENDVIPAYNTESTGVTTDSEGSDIEIDNLKPSTTYILRIKAKNEVGVGINSFQYNVTTEDIRKPYPLVIKSDRDGSSSMNYHVVWDKPDNGGKPIAHYEFSVRQVKVDGGETVPVEKAWRKFMRSDNKANPMTHFNIDNLKPDSHYQLKVQACNELGCSDDNGHFIFRTSPVAAGVSTNAAIPVLRCSNVVALVLVAVACFSAVASR